MEAEAGTTQLEWLKDELDGTMTWTRDEARALELKNIAFWWAAVCLTSLASIAGFLMEVPVIKGQGWLPDHAWIVSLLTTAGAGAEALRRTSRWRQLSKIAWIYNGTAFRIKLMVCNEMVGASDAERAALGSKLYRSAAHRYGVAKEAILDAREARLHASDDKVIAYEPVGLKDETLGSSRKK